MPTAFDVLLNAARWLEAFRESQATATGTTTTLIDDAIKHSITGVEDSNYVNGALFWITASEAGAPVFTPQLCTISAFASTTGTFTFVGSTTSHKPLAADRYGVLTSRYPKLQLYSKLNLVLAKIQNYAVPVAADVNVSAMVNQQTDVLDTVHIISIFGGQSDVTDRDWQRISRYQHANGVLKIEEPISSFDVIRYNYLTPVPEVYTPTATISDDYSKSWLAVATALELAIWRLNLGGVDVNQHTQMINRLIAEEDAERKKLWRNRQPAVNIWPSLPDR